ncbi:MAG: hypothetical protein HY370_02680 [Proteobacteria bacterium]|nr:hypothetical protein [Pseudomonadota bacterium]
MSLKRLFMAAVLVGVATVPVSAVFAEDAGESAQAAQEYGRFMGLEHECSGLVLEANDSLEEFLVLNREKPLSGIFPVIRMELPPMEGQRDVTICATRIQILRYIDKQERDDPTNEQWDRGLYNGLAMMAAQMEWDSLPPDQKNAENEKRIKQTAEEYVRDKMRELDRKFTSQKEAMRAAARALEVYENENGAIHYSPALPGAAPY